MKPASLADLHSRAFAPARGWTTAEFTSLCKAPQSRLFARDHGFALLQVVATEAELLTLAVDPDHRRKGIADALMRDCMEEIDAEIAFLEVAADNHAALALYNKHGFEVAGRRKDYYRREGAAPVDALLMQVALTRGRGGHSRA